MSKSEDVTRISIDLRNSGAVFACCGLFELAGRIDARATAWFEEASFALGANVGRVFEELARCRVMGSKRRGATAKRKFEPLDPVLFGKPFRVKVDWYLEPFRERGLKIWSGSMVPGTIVLAMQAWLRQSLNERPNLLPADRLMTTASVKPSPFHFGVEKSRHALDVGFSVDKVKDMEALHLPLVVSAL